MLCPSCNSSDLKKVSLIHAAGSHESRGRISGLLVGSSDGFLIGRYRGSSQNRLSTMLAPPTKAPYVLPVILWLVGFFIVIPALSSARNIVTRWHNGPKAMNQLTEPIESPFACLSSTQEQPGLFYFGSSGLATGMGFN
jgi:hypothetical protein